ncbi:MAG: UbiA family prenyltransferase [Candidatus Nitrosopolaris sp.]
MRQYLLLIRLPNAFTAPSNILTGYFAVVLPSYANVPNLSILMLSSALLYISGIVFNDYFDIEIDRKERPFRPLVAGIITKKKALAIAVAAMVTANFLAFTVSIASLIVAIILSATIIGYDYRLKQTMAGPVTMGSARFLNIFLGASPALAGLFFSNNDFLVLRLILVSMLMLLYVLAISILSRIEIGVTTHSKRIIVGPFIIIFAVISIIMLVGFFGIFQVDLVPSLVLFSGITIITFKQTVFQDYSSSGIQKAITNLVLSIIVLDSIFVSGTANIYYGLATLLLVIPSMALARKLYVT